jgi:hypothetical protein
MTRMQPIPASQLLARLAARVQVRLDDPEDPAAWARVSQLDREALHAIDDVLRSGENAEFYLGFWLGFSEGVLAFRDGAYAHAVAKDSAQRRGRAGGKGTAQEADKRWRLHARELLRRIAAENPSWGRQRMTTALLDHPEFVFRQDAPSEGSIARLIGTMREDGSLPARPSDSGEKP